MTRCENSQFWDKQIQAWNQQESQNHPPRCSMTSLPKLRSQIFFSVSVIKDFLKLKISIQQRIKFNHRSFVSLNSQKCRIQLCRDISIFIAFFFNLTSTIISLTICLPVIDLTLQSSEFTTLLPYKPWNKLFYRRQALGLQSQCHEWLTRRMKNNTFFIYVTRK